MKTKNENDGAAEQLRAYTHNAPGFFTPYEDVGDAINTLASPFYAPFLLAAFTAIAAVVATLAFALFLVCLIVGLGASLVGANSFRGEVLDLAEKSLLVSLVAALLTPIFAVGIAVAPVLGLIGIFTRTGASIVSAIANSIEENEEPSESMGDDSSITPTF